MGRRSERPGRLPPECRVPELPEVEIMARALGRWTADRRITTAELDDDKLLADGDVQALDGARVTGARRRAKYALLDTDRGSLVLHFRMTGMLHQRPVSQPAARGRRLSLLLDDGMVVDFVDLRRLGQAWVLPATRLGAFFDAKGLGPEPWPDAHDGAWWQDRFAGLRGPIKPALLRQDRVAGIGNIIASECLWRARIDPTCPVPQVDADAWTRLSQAVPAFIDQVIAHEGAQHDLHGAIDYVNLGGPNPFSVYGREGQPCPRCDQPLERLVQSGRGTWCCPACQIRPARRSSARTRSSSSSGSKGFGR